MGINEKIIACPLAAITLCACLFMFNLFSKESIALADVEKGPDLSWAGWGAAVLKYEKTRAPDQPYSAQSHQDASVEFQRAVRERDHFITIHWAAVRLITETIKIVVYYDQQEQSRKD